MRTPRATRTQGRGSTCAQTRGPPRRVRPPVLAVVVPLAYTHRVASYPRSCRMTRGSYRAPRTPSLNQCGLRRPSRRGELKRSSRGASGEDLSSDLLDLWCARRSRSAPPLDPLVDPRRCLLASYPGCVSPHRAAEHRAKRGCKINSSDTCCLSGRCRMGLRD